MTERRWWVTAVPVIGGVLTFGSGAFIGFWLSRALVVGFFDDTDDIQVLSVAALVGFGGVVLMLKVRRVETDRSALPAGTFLALGGAVGVGTSAAVLGTPLIGVPVLLALAAILGAAWWWRDRRIRRILTRGQQVAAEFVEVRGGDSDATSEYEGVRYLIRYTDEAGVSRQLRGSMSVPSGTVPRPGDLLSLWYDPEKPRRHVVRVSPRQD